jgi:SAM-dependent methyltransferase
MPLTRLDRAPVAPDNPAMTQDVTHDARQFAPAAARNRDPIWAVLHPHLPAKGLVLEIASGSGEHAVHFARAAGPEITFQPSDPDPASRASIDAWVAASGLANIRPGLALDATAPAWPLDHADVVLCCNMIHIAPWAAAVGLLKGAARVLTSGGLLFLYGPFKRGGRHTAPSNEAFDRDFLRARNPAWGVRDLEAVSDLAEAAGFAPPRVEEMPANNLSVLFRRQA